MSEYCPCRRIAHVGVLPIPVAHGGYAHQHPQHDNNVVWTGLDRYGWLQHDGFYFGKQELLDHGYNITTTWVR